MPVEYTVGSGLKKSLKPKFTYEVSGEVELPSLTILGAPRYIEKAFDINQVKISAKEGGDYDYKVVIKSYGSLGGTVTTHLDQTVSLGDKTVVDLTISTASVGANRTFELSLQSIDPSAATTFAKDLSVTIL